MFLAAYQCSEHTLMCQDRDVNAAKNILAVGLWDMTDGRGTCASAGIRRVDARQLTGQECTGKLTESDMSSAECSAYI